MLEAEGLPIGVVTAINGATRLEVGVDGQAGHAGATPMALRRDAFAAAAEMALMIERRARAEADLVATVGRHGRLAGRGQRHSRPRAVLDRPARAARLRAGEAALADIRARRSTRSPRERGVTATVAITHEAPAFTCDPRIVAGFDAAVESLGVPVRGCCRRGRGTTPWRSGRFRPAGMLFVRCKGGISHNPLESITDEDCAFGLAALDAIRAGFSSGLSRAFTAGQASQP